MYLTVGCLQCAFSAQRLLDITATHYTSASVGTQSLPTNHGIFPLSTSCSLIAMAGGSVDREIPIIVHRFREIGTQRFSYVR